MKFNLKTSLRRVLACLLTGGAILFPALSHAQGKGELLDRFSFGTNAFEWLLTVPNASVEFDLYPGPYNRSTLLAGMKYNWNTWHKLPPYYVFNVLDLRAEYRYHHRFTAQETDKKFAWLNPLHLDKRPWIAYYAGVYADYSNFAIKFTSRGRQGNQGGVGLSAGMELPLYQYKRGAIDLDLGFSAGLCFAKYDFFVMNAGSTAYELDGSCTILLPVVSEVRAVFNWRTVSVKDKYVKSDPQIPIFQNALADIRLNFENTTRQTFDESRTKKEAAALAASDSLYRATFTAWVLENEKDLMNQISYVQVDDDHMKILQKKIKKGTRKLLQDFEKDMRAKRIAIRKAERAQKDADKKAERDAKKAEKAAAKEAAKAEKDKAKADKAATDKGEKADKPAKEKKQKAEKPKKEKTEKPKKEKKTKEKKAE